MEVKSAERSVGKASSRTIYLIKQLKFYLTQYICIIIFLRFILLSVIDSMAAVTIIVAVRDAFPRRDKWSIKRDKRAKSERENGDH